MAESLGQDTSEKTEASGLGKGQGNGEERAVLRTDRQEFKDLGSCTNMDTCDRHWRFRVIGLGGVWAAMVRRAPQVGPACGQGETTAQTTLILPLGDVRTQE